MKNEENSPEKTQCEISALRAHDHLGIVAEAIKDVASVSTSKNPPQVGAGVVKLLP